jgi:uncharacterized OB-fold protein
MSDEKGRLKCRLCEGSGVVRHPIESLCPSCGGVGSLSDLVHRHKMTVRPPVNYVAQVVKT